MSFMPISPCCLKGSKLPGTPRGAMQCVSDGLRIDRYRACPAELKHPKTCLVMFYDAFGFNIDNPKILADRYADLLGIEVFVPDYLPNTIPPSYIEPAIEAYPGEKRSRSWLASGWTWLVTGIKVAPYLGLVSDGQACPRVDLALEDLTSAYETIGAVGFCRGATMVTYLLGKGDACPVVAGAIFHPQATPERWPRFTRPSRWLLAEDDRYMPPPKVALLREAFSDGRARAEITVYKDTVHGFAARPAWEHPGTVEAFQRANDDGAEWLKRELGL